MRRSLRSLKFVRARTPGGRNVRHFKRNENKRGRCGSCGAKISFNSYKNLSKTERRTERILPNLCSKCMREVLKQRVRV